MTWPWGEPAVYVFTLADVKDEDAALPRLEPWFLQGAYLVSTGDEDAGYRLMARPDRYVTVYTGATDDMPAMLKAHAGLPEHVLALASMENPPADPAWIYGGLFHILAASKARLAYAGGRGVEIHTKSEYALEEMGRVKTGALAPREAAFEWAPFLDPGNAAAAGAALPAFGLEGLAEGEHKLPVEESNIKTVWKGCSPAAFYNCLKYLESKKKVGLQGKGAAVIMDWIAICYHTDPADGGTTPGWILDGSRLMFKGLGYDSAVGAYARVVSKPGSFLIKFAAEIEAGYPTNLGGSGKGVFEGHSTTGIGYWKEGALAQLIIHDGWKTTPNVPVYVKYIGYPNTEIEYPAYMRSFRPRGKHAYPKADPKVLGSALARCDPTIDKWKNSFRLTSKNTVRVEAYAYEIYYYDVKGKKYFHDKPKRIYPFLGNSTWTYAKPKIKAGKVATTYFLVDSNGHLLKVKSNVRLIEAPIGRWWMVYDWANTKDGPPAVWRILENGTFTDDGAPAGTWTINKTRFRLAYSTGRRAVYVGTINKVANRMSGTMTHPENHGTWVSTRTGAMPSPPARPATPGGAKADGSGDAPRK